VEKKRIFSKSEVIATNGTALKEISEEFVPKKRKMAQI
jgi:hypothetical protein